ncbi:uncharacterized protein SCHCODRAFT_02705300 [Schizophyllum commune H4-8]|uniref:uncharacterized protein n=1 Tax=Schizophyllum commune (strain H4-8 / FGSC 9210) TaxID=578458 RepID=UPI002160BBAC|nr:uncharacterized protein SCHCODRAFT_02705300 [Schizophyllum commune H4-8]KAI5888011.1 hypothetical protein SCHCODRAFT_02705300 [Schizophyllum commune H4-8]
MSQSANSSMSALNYDGPRVPRRTPMACEFCRARKLKCDGGRPSCANCEKKKFPCNYVPVGDKSKK